MVAKNDVTGDALKSRGPSKKYDEGWERIFGKKNKEEKPVHPAETRYPHLKEFAEGHKREEEE